MLIMFCMDNNTKLCFQKRLGVLDGDALVNGVESEKLNKMPKKKTVNVRANCFRNCLFLQ